MRSLAVEESDDTSFNKLVKAKDAILQKNIKEAVTTGNPVIVSAAMTVKKACDIIENIAEMLI